MVQEVEPVLTGPVAVQRSTGEVENDYLRTQLVLASYKLPGLTAGDQTSRRRAKPAKGSKATLGAAVSGCHNTQDETSKGRKLLLRI